MRSPEVSVDLGRACRLQVPGKSKVGKLRLGSRREGKPESGLETFRGRRASKAVGGDRLGGYTPADKPNDSNSLEPPMRISWRSGAPPTGETSAKLQRNPNFSRTADTLLRRNGSPVSVDETIFPRSGHSGTGIADKSGAVDETRNLSNRRPLEYHGGRLQVRPFARQKTGGTAETFPCGRLRSHGFRRGRLKESPR